MQDLSIKFVVHDLAADITDSHDVLIAPGARRNISFLRQVFFAISTVLREQPKVVLSTGANIGVAFGIAAKLLRRKVVFVETITRVESPSLSGRIMYYLADKYYVQSVSLARAMPKAIYKGGL
jgi:UDP-N-acetylglucosamine:LPS N-acetylglucosamine transferase